MDYGDRAREARHLATTDPTMTQADIARAVGMSRQGVAQALRNVDHALPDGRHLRRGGRARGKGREMVLAEARRKMDAGERLTREERHLLQEEYRRREREARA